MFRINSDLILSKMEEMGFNQHQFSERIGTSQPTFSRMVNNKSTNIDLETIYKIAVILDLNVEDLILNTKKRQEHLPNEVLLSQIKLSIGDIYNKIETLQKRIDNDKKKPIHNQMYFDFEAKNLGIVQEDSSLYDISYISYEDKDIDILVEKLLKLLEKERRMGYKAISKRDKKEIKSLYHYIFEYHKEYDYNLLMKLQDKYLSYIFRNKFIKKYD